MSIRQQFERDSAVLSKRMGKCLACRFYVFGQCRKFPPQVISKHESFWPYVGRRGIDGCGQWESNRSQQSKQDVPSIALRLVHNCKLSIKVQNILEYIPIATLGELSVTEPRFLLKQRTFGRYSLREIEDVLRRHGIDWDKSIAVGTCQLL